MTNLISEAASTLDEISFLAIPTLVGIMLSFLLLGALLVQVYLYHVQFPNDQKFIKCIVYGISLLDMLIIVVSNIIAWAALSASWGHFSLLTLSKWSLAILPCLTGFASIWMHSFFCWRMWVLRRLYILPGCILTISLAAWGVATFCGVYGRQLGIDKLHVLKPFIIFWFGGSCLCNLLITGTMIYILFPPQSQSFSRKTTGVVQNLVRLTVETGMTACIVALAEVSLFVICPQNYGYVIPFFIISTIHANTLMASLNSRSLLPVPPLCARKASLTLWDNRPPTSAYLRRDRSECQDTLDTDSVEDESSFIEVPLKDRKSTYHSHNQFPAAYFAA